MAGAMGRTSNYACYVTDDSDREIVYDEHALGYSICVDIAQDTMWLLDEGKSVVRCTSISILARTVSN